MSNQEVEVPKAIRDEFIQLSLWAATSAGSHSAHKWVGGEVTLAELQVVRELLLPKQELPRSGEFAFEDFLSESTREICECCLRGAFVGGFEQVVVHVIRLIEAVQKGKKRERRSGLRDARRKVDIHVADPKKK